MTYRNNVKAICKAKGITQNELAERLGITAISLNQTLRGEYPQLQSLEKIAKALGVHISELFDKPDGELTALIDYKDKLYRFDNMEALESFVLDIRENKKGEEEGL